MTAPAIEAQNVSKVYETEYVQTTAVNNVSLRIDRGEFVSIVGVSGSGKSTLLGVLGLIHTPDNGRILIEGEDTSKLSTGQLRRLRGQKIGFVFQSFHLVDTLSAVENVKLALRYSDLDKSARHKRAVEMLDRLGMSSRSDHFPPQLSGGQQQRIAIARALANEPGIIFADEPTGNLDTETGEIVMDIFRDIQNGGTSIVCVTHSNEIAEKTDRTLRMMDGKLSNT